MKGLGIDLCEIARIEHAVQTSERFLLRYYTEAERCWIDRRGRAGMQSAAAMFAAKEAFLKAAGIGIGRGVELCDIEILHDAAGAPRYALHGGAQRKLEEMGACAAMLSLSHEAGMAAAVCVLE